MSTATVSDVAAFAYWREIISTTFVPLTAEPASSNQFHGAITSASVGELKLTKVIAEGQRVRRTPTLIARGVDEYVLASIQLKGQCIIQQDGRTASISEGEMAFYDSTRPYELFFNAPLSQLVVQVPKQELALRDTRAMTALTLGEDTPGSVVASCLRSFADTAMANASVQMEALVPHTVGLLCAAASYASRSRPAEVAVEALTRQRVETFLKENLADASIDGEKVAKACLISRRTLYRILGDFGVNGRLRELRVKHAQELLLRTPDRLIASVGGACGFESESGFYRAFRSSTGLTPGEYRRLKGGFPVKPASTQ